MLTLPLLLQERKPNAASIASQPALPLIFLLREKRFYLLSLKCKASIGDIPRSQVR
jgi:hypothetical protein